MPRLHQLPRSGLHPVATVEGIAQDHFQGGLSGGASYLTRVAFPHVRLPKKVVIWAGKENYKCTQAVAGLGLKGKLSTQNVLSREAEGRECCSSLKQTVFWCCGQKMDGTKKESAAEKRAAVCWYVVRLQECCCLLSYVAPFTENERHSCVGGLPGVSVSVIDLFVGVRRLPYRCLLRRGVNGIVFRNEATPADRAMCERRRANALMMY